MSISEITSHLRPADSESGKTARWRFVAQVSRFVRSKYIESALFERSTTFKDIAVPGCRSWRTQEVADKVIARFTKAGCWFEFQDDGITLSMLAVRDAGGWEVGDSAAIAETLSDCLNFEASEKARLSVTVEKDGGITFGHFTVPEEVPNGKSEEEVREWRRTNFNHWSSPHSYCSNGKFLFVTFREASNYPEVFLQVAYPDRF